MITKELYDDYLAGLLAGRRRSCLGVVEGLLEGEVPLERLYEDLFRATLYDVGYRWETNQISVATEHLATAITERAMSLVLPRLFSTPRRGRSAIVSCVANEHHQVGGRMVADLFELRGWDGHFLGANTPLEGLLAMVRERRPDAVGLSLSIETGAERLFAAIGNLRASNAQLPILVGGQAFRTGRVTLPESFGGVYVLSDLDELDRFIRGFGV